jgi:hypothetical protein
MRFREFTLRPLLARPAPKAKTPAEVEQLWKARPNGWVALTVPELRKRIGLDP